MRASHFHMPIKGEEAHYKGGWIVRQKVIGPLALNGRATSHRIHLTPHGCNASGGVVYQGDGENQFFVFSGHSVQPLCCSLQVAQLHQSTQTLQLRREFLADPWLLSGNDL